MCPDRHRVASHLDRSVLPTSGLIEVRTFCQYFCHLAMLNDHLPKRELYHIISNKSSEQELICGYIHRNTPDFLILSLTHMKHWLNDGQCVVHILYVHLTHCKQNSVVIKMFHPIFKASNNSLNGVLLKT